MGVMKQLQMERESKKTIEQLSKEMDLDKAVENLVKPEVAAPST